MNCDYPECACTTAVSWDGACPKLAKIHPNIKLNRGEAGLHAVRTEIKRMISGLEELLERVK